LEQGRPELFTERGRALDQVPDQLGRVPELGVVGDLLRRLEREPELGRDLSGPVEQVLLPRHPIERVVDLDRGEFRGVEREAVLVRELLRIEEALPLLERVTGGSDVV
jgi:hypothetical protein